MQLVTKLVAAGTGAFVISGAIVGITIPILNKNKNTGGLTPAREFADCSTVECGEHMECIKDVSKYPTCICSSGFVTVARETDEGREKVCHKKCENSTQCKSDEVCKEDFEFGIFCVASADVEACDETIRCQAPEACDIVGSSPKCKCPNNKLLIEMETSGTPARQCLKICETSSHCEMSEVCKALEFGIVCVASTDLEACDETIRCEHPEACGLVDSSPKCKCPFFELLIVTETSGTTERRCLKSCSTTDNCEAGTLCFEDSILTQTYCEDRDRITDCSAAVKCTSDTECGLTIDQTTECLCKIGFTEVHENGFTASRRLCHTRTCTDSSCCRDLELCYQDETSNELYCDDRTKGCDGAVCPDKFECFDTLKGYSECFCSKGYTETSEFNTDNVRTDPGMCEEQTCATSDDCQQKYLCYSDSAHDQFGICSTRLKGCDGVRCPVETYGCRETFSGFVDCLCREGEYTAVDARETGGTMRGCHLLTCATSNDCDGTSLCYQDSVTEDFFCDDTLTVCTSEVVCPEGFHCDDSGVRPQCVCDDDEETQRIQTTQIMTMTDNDGRNISERYCYLSCADSNDCFPGTICITDATFIGNGCSEDRTPYRNKCSRVLCSPLTECYNHHVVADCLCNIRIPTIIEPTDSGSMRICNDDGVVCSDDTDCFQDGNVVCLLDPVALQGRCVDPNVVISCELVQCAFNTICFADNNWKCECQPGEQLDYDICFTICDTDENCEEKGFGRCRNNLCEYYR